MLGITVCPLRSAFGLSCPGCGMTRAWWALLAGDLQGAFHYHPLFWLPVPALLLLVFGDRLPDRVFRGLLFLMLALYLTVYGIRLADPADEVVWFHPERGMFLQGHAPFVTGAALAAYRIGGPVSDHESTCAAEVTEKLRNGVHINLRASSIVDNLSFLVDGCKDHPWRDFVSFCTDDVHASDLLTVGHINRVVGKAIEAGIDGKEAIKLATLNAAREYGFDDLGAIAPGYIADMQLVPELNGCRPAAVFVEGELAAENGVYVGADAWKKDVTLPNTVNIPQITGPESFELRVPEGYTGSTITVNVLTPPFEGAIVRTAIPTELPVKDGKVDISADPTLDFVCCANRYGTGTKTIAVYRNFHLDKGAIASTISHDSHNLTVIYRDEREAWLAADTLRRYGGGVCAVLEGEESHIALPAAGLMSLSTCEEVAAQIDEVQEKINRLSGNRLPVLASAILALPVLPSVVITDLGLVDGSNQTFIPVFIQ